MSHHQFYLLILFLIIHDQLKSYIPTLDNELKKEEVTLFHSSFQKVSHSHSLFLCFHFIPFTNVVVSESLYFGRVLTASVSWYLFFWRGYYVISKKLYRESMIK